MNILFEVFLAVLEPLFYVVIVYGAYKFWTVYGHDFISPE